VFQDTALRKIEDGFTRYSAVVAFNENFYELRNTSTSMLADIAYTKRIGSNSKEARQANFLARKVIEFISTSRWLSVYGLNYHDTMKLTYAEWIMMQDQLNDLTPLPSPENPPRPPVPT
jgi:hypothetical protein